MTNKNKSIANIHKEIEKDQQFEIFKEAVCRDHMHDFTSDLMLEMAFIIFKPPQQMQIIAKSWVEKKRQELEKDLKDAPTKHKQVVISCLDYVTEVVNKYVEIKETKKIIVPSMQFEPKNRR